jgi:hypothetical protein
VPTATKLPPATVRIHACVRTLPVCPHSGMVSQGRRMHRQR